MKATAAALLLLLAAASAFAQGKVTLANNVDSPIVLPPYPMVMAADVAYAGQPLPTTGPLPSGVTLMAGLYAGTTPGNMTLQGSVLVNPAGGTGQPAGLIPPTHIILNGIPGGTPTSFIVRVWDSRYPRFELAMLTGGSYLFWKGPFTMTPGASIAYPNTYSGGGTTWQPGPFDCVPEPSSLGLAGLGAAALLIFRRRK